MKGVLPQPKRGGLLRSTTPTPLLRCSSLFHSMRAHFTSRHIFILLWMGVYGFVCHQIGSSSSATRSCLIQTSHKLSSSPRQARITTGATRSELADESKLPYKCGLVFFYHVPSTGGVRCFVVCVHFVPSFPCQSVIGLLSYAPALHFVIAQHRVQSTNGCCNMHQSKEGKWNTLLIGDLEAMRVSNEYKVGCVLSFG